MQKTQNNKIKKKRVYKFIFILHIIMFLNVDVFFDGTYAWKMMSQCHCWDWEIQLERL